MQDIKFKNVNFSNSRFRELVEREVRAGRKQKEIAQEMQLSPASISNYKANQPPKSEELFRIARYFGVTMESFFDDEHVIPSGKALAINSALQREVRRSGVTDEAIRLAAQTAEMLVRLQDELKKLT